MGVDIRIHGAIETANFGDILLAWFCYDHLLHNSNVDEIKVYDACDKAYDILKAEKPKNRKYGKAIFFGGGYLGDTRSFKAMLHKVRVHYLPMFECILKRIPYIIVGAGARKFVNPLFIPFIRYCCNGADGIIVRNSESQEDLQRIGVHNIYDVTADMAVLFNNTMIPDYAVEFVDKKLETYVKRKKIVVHTGNCRP